MTAVLIAEDDQRIWTFVRNGLSRYGFTATVVTDGEAAHRHARRAGTDVMVLDSTLPPTDGFQVLRRLRDGGSSLPVVMMLARTGLADNLARCRSAADGYVVKPFRLEQLLVAVQRQLAVPRTPGPTVLSHGGLRLDLRTRRAHMGTYWVQLSSRECALAEIFLRYPGRTLTREQLRRHVWGEDDTRSPNLVDVYVAYLRRKLGIRRFTACRGVGYRLELDDPPR